MSIEWVLLLRRRGGRGRHAFVFARHVNNFGTMAFHVFQAIPFLYELRELLDWSCTATSLTLFDWLKLEDISISLFFVTVSRQNRQRHRLGERQPRYTKFFQVCTKNICMPFGCMTHQSRRSCCVCVLISPTISSCFDVPAVLWMHSLICSPLNPSIRPLHVIISSLRCLSNWVSVQGTLLFLGLLLLLWVPLLVFSSGNPTYQVSNLLLPIICYTDSSQVQHVA